MLQPLFTMIVFTLIFGRFAKIETATPDVPYPVFVFAGLIFWTYFSGAVTGAGMSLISQQHLLTKVYFPRLFVPMACIGTVLVDLAISLGVFAFLMIYYGVAPSWQSPLLVPLIGLMTLASLGLGCLFASLTVVYRDFRYIVSFAMQIMMFLSPVIYPLDMLPKAYRPILSLNPMFGLIDGSRSAVLGTPWHLHRWRSRRPPRWRCSSSASITSARPSVVSPTWSDSPHPAHLATHHEPTRDHRRRPEQVLSPGRPVAAGGFVSARPSPWR